MQTPMDIKGIRLGEGRPVLCVPVTEDTAEAVIAHVRELADRKIPMIEWRADAFRDLSDADAVSDVLAQIAPLTQHTVVLFTVRTRAQGGAADLPERELAYLQEVAAKSGSVDLVDVEYLEGDRPERRIRRLRQMGVRVIASHHDFARTPDDVLLAAVMDQLAKSGADLAKLAVMPRSAEDVIRLLALTEETRRRYPDLPLITIAMGAQGVISRVAGEAFGSCVTFGADQIASAPGQLPADELDQILDMLHAGMTASSVFLIGFMGVGKTTVADKLGDRLGWQVVDLDAEIERTEGMTIAAMFEQYGEEYFRDRESEALARVALDGPMVVSCGGGCVLQEENVARMKRQGTVALLCAEPETVYERIKGETDRPLLNGKMDVAHIAALMEERNAIYEAVCDIAISTDHQSPEQIAREIIKKI